MSPKQSKMRVVSFDPSLRNWGVAVFSYSPNFFELEKTYVIQTKPHKGISTNLSDLESCSLLSTDIGYALKEAELVIAELPIGSQSSRAMASYGISIALLASIKVPLITVSPFDIKRFFGSSYSEKSVIVDWAKKQYPNKLSKPFCKANHEADAIAAFHVALPNIRKHYENLSR